MNNASESAATAMATPRNDASLFSEERRGMNPASDLSEDEDFHCKPPVRYPLLVVAGAVFLAVLFLCGLFAEQLAPAGYAAQDLTARLSPPVWLGGKSGLLGTDFLGRDILSRLLYAIRISLLVAFVGTLISCTLGTTLGFLAAHKKGWVDEFIMMLIDFQASMPFVLIALAILAFLGNSLGLFIAVMGLNGWERFARFTRGLARSASARGYVNAVRVMGASPLRVYFKHILPNIIGVLIVQFTLNFPSTVLLESSLSFLGLGIQPPLTSLGAMLGEGRNYLINAWWISVAPGAVIFCVTLSACILGDWLRDRLDPTLR